MRCLFQCFLIGSAALGGCAVSHEPLPPQTHSLPDTTGYAAIRPEEGVFVFRVIPGADDPWPERERIISWSPYDWRIVAGSEGQLIASLGVVTESAFAIRGYESLHEVLRDAELRSCDLQGAHYISCGTPLEGEYYIAASRVVMRIRDPEFLSRFLELRPAYVRLVTMLLDTYTGSDSVPVSYHAH